MLLASRLFKFLLCTSFWIFHTLPSEIIEIDSLQTINTWILKLDKDDLVLFDVDFTLIVPNDHILRPGGQTLIRVTEVLKDPAFVPPGKYPPGFLHGQIIAKAKSFLVEDYSIPLIHELQKRSVPTIAFTAVMTGKFGSIDKLEDFRIHELKEFGLDFSGAFPQITTLEFPKKSERESHPLYKSGILFSAKHPKGEVLRQFLEVIQWHPKKVVFFDDKLAFLESVESILAEMKIDFVGFHYTAAEKLPCILDKAQAEFQFRYLGKYGHWLSDEEAKNMMDKEKTP